MSLNVIARSGSDEAIHASRRSMDCFAYARNDVGRSHNAFNCHHPRRRAIQYSRDADDKTEKPRRTGYSAFAEYDDCGRYIDPRSTEPIYNTTARDGRSTACGNAATRRF